MRCEWRSKRLLIVFCIMNPVAMEMHQRALEFAHTVLVNWAGTGCKPQGGLYFLGAFETFAP